MIVDVSSHNGAINWNTAKASGVKAALIRCGYGSDAIKYDDPRYKANIEGALSAGVVVGVYLYSYAKNNEGARSEAAHALRLIAPYKDKIKLPIFVDIEERDRTAGASERAVIFCDTLKAAGYKAGVYADFNFWCDYLQGLKNYDCYRWVAKWSEPKPTGRVDLWQYDAYGKVAGIGSGVDLDRAYGELEEIINSKEPKPEPGEKIMIGVDVLKKGSKGSEVFIRAYEELEEIINGKEPKPEPGEKIMIGVDVLKKGSKGSEVFIVQSFLKCKGYKGENGKVLALDQSWGRNVDFAFGNWQKDAGLVPDKICGEKSWNKMING